MSARKFLLSGLSLALVCSSLGEVRRAAAADAQRPEMRIVVVGSSEQESWLSHLLDPNDPNRHASVSLSARFVETDVLAADGAGDAALSCWVDLRDPTRARIYFRAKSSDRFLLRDLELSGHYDDLDREALSEVLSTSASALLENEHAGLSRAETVQLMAERRETHAPVATRPAPAPLEPVPERAARAKSSLSASLFYGGQAFAHELPIRHGPGLWLSLGRPIGARFAALWGEGRYYLPLRGRAESASVRLESVLVSAGLELGFRFNEGSTPRELSARVGAGAELVHASAEPGFASVPLTLSEPHWSTFTLLTSSIGATTQLAPGARLGARVRLDFEPRLARYDVAIGAAHETLVTPLHVRPGVTLELSTP